MAFERLKTLLTEAPVLTTFNHTQTLSLHMVASGLELGPILYQGVMKDKSVLVYSSCYLNVHKNYGIPDLEALAIIWAVKKNWHYLWGHHFNCDGSPFFVQSEDDAGSERKTGAMDVGSGQASIQYRAQERDSASGCGHVIMSTPGE